MKRSASVRRASRPQRVLLTSITGLAAVAGANALFARWTERRHTPRGAFMIVDGVRLHYTDRGEGPAVVLIHGNAVTGEDWDTSGVADILLRTHRVIVFDRPGFGHSTRPHGAPWTAARQADLIHRALSGLAVERPVVVGHSWGAIVALALAERHQPDVAALVLVSGYYFETFRPDVPIVGVAALPVIGDVLRYTVLPLLGWLQMPLLKRAMFAPNRVTPRFERAYSTAMALRPSQIRAGVQDGALMVRSAKALRARYGELTLPVTIIAGQGDAIVFARMAGRLHAVLPHSALRIIRGAGHMLHHVDPQVVAEAVRDITIRSEAIAVQDAAG
ncbi:alpha/beta fold hydrolase [Rhodopila globiformis]|uniref:Alpha/beta hydrolase n=1 Tax=Rhodopila globiformis TaxID=1071 RepID=A0A2S6MTN9_RHOGL|nr:alpha/beta hydrolase [Rhodopila globiformis]PPQ25720.1 alpha/beta hydrolase [Rhodopila globiformis]